MSFLNVSQWDKQLEHFEYLHLQRNYLNYLLNLKYLVNLKKVFYHSQVQKRNLNIFLNSHILIMHLHYHWSYHS